MKILILNADDFGICQSVNRGIIECLNRSFITDLSFMINPPQFQTSRKMLQAINKNDVGFHLNLTLGRSIRGPVSKLVDSSGTYHSYLPLMYRLVHKQILFSHLYSEIRSQLEFLLNYGYNITHIDSHQNIHLLPSIFKALLRVECDLGLNVPIRIPLESWTTPHNITLRNLYRILIINLLSTVTLYKHKYDVKVRCIGANLYNNNRRDLSINRILETIKTSSHDVFEIPVHPGYPSSTLLKYDKYSTPRLSELQMLEKQPFASETQWLVLKSFSNIVSSNCKMR